ncbi:MAG: fumarylacetoacetate hydrolase family protein [Pigmentiphaga sp.]
MKLATLKNGKRDGALIIVNRELTHAAPAADIAITLQEAIDNWSVKEPLLTERFNLLQGGKLTGSFPLDTKALAAPLPRAYAWTDSSVYLNHMELARRLRGAALPVGYRDEPRFYDGVSHTFWASGDPLPCPPGDVGLDFEGEIAVILNDVPANTPPEATADKILLLALLNDTTLRTVFADQMGRGFTNYQGKPPCSMAPVVVTPDELGPHWDGKRLSLPLSCHVNGKCIGTPNTGADMAFDFPQIISAASKHRPLGAGMVLGAGTVSNRNSSVGCACLAEVRMLEQLEHGEPRSRYLEPGDRVWLEVHDDTGQSVFGRLEHHVVPQ